MFDFSDANFQPTGHPEKRFSPAIGTRLHVYEIFFVFPFTIHIRDFLLYLFLAVHSTSLVNAKCGKSRGKRLRIPGTVFRFNGRGYLAKIGLCDWLNLSNFIHRNIYFCYEFTFVFFQFLIDTMNIWIKWFKKKYKWSLFYYMTSSHGLIISIKSQNNAANWKCVKRPHKTCCSASNKTQFHLISANGLAS